MKDVIFDDFQNSVNNSLLRHKSILDILSKYQESQARASRAICKAVTNCGCIEICAKKQNMLEDTDLSLEELNPRLSSHIKGDLFENCREVIERELVNNLFYLTPIPST